MAPTQSTIWRTLNENLSTEPLPTGLDAAWDGGIGLINKFLPQQHRFMRRAGKVLALEKDFAELGSSTLRSAAVELREKFRRARNSDEDLERAFALLREVAARQLNLRPFAVQIAGAFALEAGFIAEMATGEGKTLAAALAATVSGWRGKGCHVVTVNDYLARRDAEWMGPIYRFCGLRTACIQQQSPAEDRRQAYLADVTYCTNKEVAADFLRDRLVLGRLKGLSSVLIAGIAGFSRSVTDRLVQRGLHRAIVDEADSILVDEAVTPLIISGDSGSGEQVECFKQAVDVAEKLQTNVDYNVNRHYREIEFTQAGRSRLEELTAELGGIWKGARRRAEMVTQALTAKELFTCDKNYVIDDGKVVIVDEFTGRLMPDRTWRDGLHQAIEAKENLEVTIPKHNYARISFQRFFRLYHRLCGMTGTAKEATAEFWHIYHLPVVVIPTNRPCARVILPDKVLPDTSAKWKTIVEEIKQVHSTHRPILVGTRSVHDSEHLSRLLTAEDLAYQVLNAVHHREEAQIVAGAGQPDTITVATNMAGRGTDIKLGRGVAEKGGLHVIAAERNESARIDRQLFGRSARQGDPGSARAIVSLDDEFVSRYTGPFVRYLKRRYAESQRDISSRRTRAVFRLAQLRAERLALRQRKTVLQTDHWLDEQLGFAGAE